MSRTLGYKFLTFRLHLWHLQRWLPQIQAKDQEFVTSENGPPGRKISYTLPPAANKLPVKILKELVPSSILASWSAHLNYLDLINMAVLGKRYKLRSSQGSYAGQLDFYNLQFDRIMRLSLRSKSNNIDFLTQIRFFSIATQLSSLRRVDPDSGITHI